MNPRELVNRIRSGPAELVLEAPLYDFNELLQALQSSETIRSVTCYSQLQLYITEYEWVLLVKTLGNIKDIQNLTFWCRAGSQHFRPFQAVAEAVNSAHSLCALRIDLHHPFTAPGGQTFGLAALANALREHAALQELIWFDFRTAGLEAPQDLSLDPVLRALPACPQLQRVSIMTKHASVGAMTNLLQLRPATDLRLVLETNHWLAVADEIRQGRCKIKYLSLFLYAEAISDATEAVKAVASAIRLDQNLEIITLRMKDGFADEACMALAKALTVNKTLHKIKLAVDCFPYRAHRTTLGAPAYEAFSAMLNVNTSLVLQLPPFGNAVDDERIIDSHNQLVIEQRLNQVGRGRLLTSSNHSTREQWVNALFDLNSSIVDDPPVFQVSCLYSLLRLNPAVCMLPVEARRETYWGIFTA
jgi:hypothetical protein